MYSGLYLNKNIRHSMWLKKINVSQIHMKKSKVLYKNINNKEHLLIIQENKIMVRKHCNLNKFTDC